MSETRREQFIDTNILIYAYDSNAGYKHLHASQMIQRLWKSGEGCLSIQVLQEFYYNVTRKLAVPLRSEIAAQVISDFSLWRVHRPSIRDLLDAIHLQARHQIGFWDAMILNSAAKLECEVIWSEDLNSGQSYGQVRVLNPFIGPNGQSQ